MKSIAKIVCMFLRVRTMPTLSTLFVPRRSQSLQMKLANTVPAAGFDMSMAGYTAVAYTDLQDYWPEVLAGTLTPEDMAAKVDADTNEFMVERGTYTAKLSSAESA